MNLCWRFGSLYWKVACLSVNAGNINEEVSRGTDYGAVAKAIGDMPKGFVLPPDINLAGTEFMPLEAENKAMYSLSAINGIGDEIVNNIIQGRPYSSFEDFITKMIDTKLVTPAKGYQLIKAGCFDRINPDRFGLMIQYVNYVTEQKKKLTTANINKLVEYSLVPEEFQNHVVLYQFRKLVFTKANCIEMVNKTQGIYKIPTNAVQYFKNVCYNAFEPAVDYDDNGDIVLKSKEFDKIYKILMENFIEWLSTNEAVESYNNYLRGANWDKYCSGSLAKWEMDSIVFYTNDHEIDEYPINEYYPIVNFSDLPRTPEQIDCINKSGKKYKQYKLSLIAGTVVDKNKIKSTVTLNTKAGIVELKLDKGRFAYYDRNVDNDKSWITRGNKLVIIGYRRGESFIPKVYSDSLYKHSIVKINGFSNGRISFKLDRTFANDEE